MASTIKVDKIEGSTGSTVTVPTGQTLTVTDGIPVASGGTGLASFTQGDILYATGATTLVKLAKGTGRQGLQTNSGATAPEWTNSPQSLMTAAGDILYASGANTLAKLAKGSDTEVLTLASGVPSWAAAAGGGSWNFLNKTTISDDATVDIETSIDSTYPLYAMVFKNFQPATSGQSVFWRAKIGGSYQTTADYQYHSMSAQSNQTAWDYANGLSAGAVRVELVNVGIGNGVSEGLNGIFYLPDPSDTAIQKNCWWSCAFQDGSAIWCRTNGFGGFDSSTGAITGIQFYMGSGNVTAGDISLYGISAS